MKKLATLLIPILIIGIALSSGCVQDEEVVETGPSGEVNIYKGIWTPTSLSDDPIKLDADIQKLKDTGVNTIFLPSSPPQVEHCLEGISPDSELAKKLKEVIPIEREIMIANIQAAHRNGLRVGLAMTTCSPASEKITLEEWNSQVIEHAKLAEEYNVELFAPMNEPEALFGPSASATWGQEILPKIREVYHGKVIWKGGAIGDIQPAPMSEPAPTNYSGYDYIGFSISVGSIQTLEDFSQRVDYVLDTFLSYAERDNCKVIISEFYGKLPYRWETNAWSEEKEARAHEIILEKGRGKVDGFFVLDFLGLSIFGDEVPRMPIPEKSSKTKEVIKRYFTEILK